MESVKDTKSLSRSSRYIFVFIFGFVFGILFSSYLKIAPLLCGFIFVIALAILLADKIQNKKLQQEIIFISLGLIAFSLGAFRYDIKDFHIDIPPTMTGIVVSEPEHRDTDVRFVMLADNREKVLVSTDMFSRVEYGDRAEVQGKLKQPGVITDEVTGRTFDYTAYLAKDDIYYTINYANVVVVGSEQSNSAVFTRKRAPTPDGMSIALRPNPTGSDALEIAPVRRSDSQEVTLSPTPPLKGRGEGVGWSIELRSALIRLKNSFIGKMKEIWPEPESSLLAGLVVSGKQALSKDILDEFRRAGVVHIVVLSGYNITIVAKFFFVIFSALFTALRIRSGKAPRIASVMGIVLFVLMAGATATVIRAAIMALTAVGGQLLGRTYNASRALYFAGFIMLLENPKILVFDPSFQLSFLATLAMIYVSPILERYLQKIPAKFDMRSLVATTISTQIVVLPFLIYTMGNVSLVSLISNMLILFFVPYAMLVGFSATLISYISTYIALPLSYVSHLLLAWILGVAHVLGNIKYASVQVSSPLWLTLMCYAALVTLVWLYRLPAQSGNFLRRLSN